VNPTDDDDDEGSSTDAASSKNETVFEKQEREYKEQEAGLKDLKEAAEDSKDKASEAYSNTTDHAKDFVGATTTPKAQNESWTKENPAQEGHRVTKGLEEGGAHIPAQDDQATGGPEDQSTSWPPSTSGGSLHEVLVEHNEYDEYSIPDDDDSGIKQQMADSRATAQNVSDHAVHLGRAEVHAFTKPQAQNESWFKQEGEQDVTRQLVRGNAIGHLMTGGVSDGSYGSHPEGGDATVTEEDFKNATGADKDSTDSDSDESPSLLQSDDLSDVTNGGDDLSKTTMQDVVDEVKAQVQSVRNASAAAIHEGRQQVGAFTIPKAQNESWFHTPAGGQDVSAKIVPYDSVGHLMTSGAEGSYGPYGGQNSATMNDTATRKEFATDSTSPGDSTTEILVQELDSAFSGASSTMRSNSTLNETEADSEIYSPERMAEEQKAFEADMLNETSVMNSTQKTLHNSSAAYEHDHIIEREADMWRQSQDTSAAVWDAVAHENDATEATLPPTPPPTLSFHSDAPNRPPREESQAAEDLLQVLSQPEDAW
jgi:hypothetical protein